MSYKYLVKPGHVTSKSDGDVHYISFTQLVRLYGVDADECLNYDSMQMRGNTPDFLDNLIVLEPRYDGNYNPPPQEGKDTE